LDVLTAIQIHRRFGISFWDAMVVSSARRQGCRILWSEDLNDGQDYEGVVVRNPFRGI
jgi:predicted nucleic acid-binding protein